LTDGRINVGKAVAEEVQTSRQAADGDDTRGISRFLLVAGLITLAATCAVVTYRGLDAFLAAPRARHSRSSLYDFCGMLLIVLPLTAPFISLLAVLARLPSVLAVLKAHAAVYVCAMVVYLSTSAVGRSSFGDQFVDLIRLVLFIVLAAELAALLYTEGYVREELGEWARPRFLFTGLTAAVLGGCYAGGWAWSETIPARVIAGAEAQAGNLPYCLTSNGRPARRRADLTGRHMRADWNGGFAGNFNAVLVVEAPAGRRYFNWSYRANGFQPLDERAVREPHRDPQFRCEPAVHFARGWL
jgi:hypothetical protein